MLCNVQASAEFQSSLEEAVTTVQAREHGRAEAAIDKLKAAHYTELKAAKTAGQQAATHEAMSREKTVKRTLAKKIASSKKLSKTAKIDALLSMSESRNDQFCINAYCVKHTTEFQGDFNARMVARRKKTLSQESMDGDTGASPTQSTGLPSSLVCRSS